MSTTRRMRPRTAPTFVLCLGLLGSQASTQDRSRAAEKPKTWSDPRLAAAEDPDFSLQGEYASPGRGVQVVALGKGRFRVVTYPGGLPGLGHDGEPKSQS